MVVHLPHWHIGSGSDTITSFEPALSHQTVTTKNMKVSLQISEKEQEGSANPWSFFPKFPLFDHLQVLFKGRSTKIGLGKTKKMGKNKLHICVGPTSKRERESTKRKGKQEKANMLIFFHRLYSISVVYCIIKNKRDIRLPPPPFLLHTISWSDYIFLESLEEIFENFDSLLILGFLLNCSSFIIGINCCPIALCTRTKQNILQYIPESNMQQLIKYYRTKTTLLKARSKLSGESKKQHVIYYNIV